MCALSIGTFLCGIVTYAYFNEWIIVRNPWHSLECSSEYQPRVQRTDISLFFWHSDHWHTEKITVGLPHDMQERVIIIVNAWLHEAAQSNFITHACTAEAALFDARTHTIYLSLNKSPFDLHKSTYAQISVIESLLHTLADTLPEDISMVQLLINHAIPEMSYLDCTQPFPIQGLGIIK